MSLLVAIGLIMVSAQAVAAPREVLSYEPAVVTLEGVLELQTFPGPPNYESIAEGDDIERHFYLRLLKPVDVLPTEKDAVADNNVAERNVEILQLSIGEEDDLLWRKFREAGKGKTVKVRGTLFHRFNGHHHSRELLIVKSMEPVVR